MPKRSTTQHPALLASASKQVKEEILAMDEEELENLRGWARFTPREKKWLAMFAYHRNAQATSVALGFSPQYHYGRMMKNPYFKEAYETREWTGVRIARYMSIDSLVLAAQTLQDFVHPDNPQKLDGKSRVDSLKLLYDLHSARKSPDQGTMFGGSHTYINAASVNMFNTGRSNPIHKDGYERDVENVIEVSGESVD